MSRRSECLINNNLINYCSTRRYNLADQTYQFLRETNESTQKEICCFYDGYPIGNSRAVGLPKRHNRDGTFTVWGYFCSYECARAYINESSYSNNRPKDTSMLALLAMKTYGIHFRLYRALDKNLLKRYGGPLSVDEWRKENLSNRLWTICTPHTERTFSTYQCFLHTPDTIHLPNQLTKKKTEEIFESNRSFQLSKRTTPAHYTKKSLLSLFKKEN